MNFFGWGDPFAKDFKMPTHLLPLSNALPTAAALPSVNPSLLPSSSPFYFSLLLLPLTSAFNMQTSLVTFYY